MRSTSFLLNMGRYSKRSDSLIDVYLRNDKLHLLREKYKVYEANMCVFSYIFGTIRSGWHRSVLMSPCMSTKLLRPSNILYIHVGKRTGQQWADEFLCGRRLNDEAQTMSIECDKVDGEKDTIDLPFFLGNMMSSSTWSFTTICTK